MRYADFKALVASRGWTMAELRCDIPAEENLLVLMDAIMMCEACERGDHEQCGMQTWCECDCAGDARYYRPAGAVDH